MHTCNLRTEEVKTGGSLGPAATGHPGFSEDPGSKNKAEKTKQDTLSPSPAPWHGVPIATHVCGRGDGRDKVVPNLRKTFHSASEEWVGPLSKQCQSVERSRTEQASVSYVREGSLK